MRQRIKDAPHSHLGDLTMTRIVIASLGLFLASLVLVAGSGCSSQSPILSHITEGSEAFQSVQTSGNPIPKEELKSAVGVALVKCFQAGVVFGMMGGSGVAVKKLPSGWSSPVAIGVVKGDFGALIGAQYLDIVMVFSDAAAFDKFITDGSYFCAGAEGTAATNTVSTRAAGAPVKSYVRAAGLYGAASIGGLGVTFKEKANAAAYGADATVVDILNGKFPQPPGGIELSKQLESGT
ncbi:MAG: hypothetical protein EXS17_06630 [Phycisphaerales bacterium]|nr:hypothetical protein [Phycisphaerales bacterium]